MFILVFRNRSLRKRPGNVPCKFRLTDEERWTSGQGLWVSIASLVLAEGTVEVAAKREDRAGLLGPFAESRKL